MENDYDVDEFIHDAEALEYAQEDFWDDLGGDDDWYEEALEAELARYWYE